MEERYYEDKTKSINYYVEKVVENVVERYFEKLDIEDVQDDLPDEMFDENGNLFIDEAGLDQGEDHSQKLVEPSEHHQPEDSFEGLSYCRQDEEHEYEDEGESNHLEHLLGSGDVLSYPCADDVGEPG